MVGWQQIGPPYPKPGGPLQLDHHARCNKLAASYHELKSQCHEQVSAFHINIYTTLIIWFSVGHAIRYQPMTLNMSPLLPMGVFLWIWNFQTTLDV